ncbi:hypothetical protein LCGC14_2699980 [marine sediment metagenome]|uniref:Uncharacterized protein n=1 Tax=marine sediment metagenome TaxID=412755 RepID=A0A0F8ZG29_9ZZZZ
MARSVAGMDEMLWRKGGMKLHGIVLEADECLEMGVDPVTHRLYVRLRAKGLMQEAIVDHEDFGPEVIEALRQSIQFASHTPR